VPAPTAALDIAGVRYRPLIPATLGVDLVSATLTTTHSSLIDNVNSVLRNLAVDSDH